MIDRAEKRSVIDRQIQPAINEIKNSVWLRSQLMEMSLGELKKLANEIQGTTSGEAMELIVVGIADCEAFN